jgi:hypothetical protein
MSHLYVELDDETHDRIRTAAKDDSRSVASWIRAHFKELFEKEDECKASESSTSE